MPSSPTKTDELSGLVTTLAEKHDVPGCVVVLDRGGEISTATYGLTNLATGVPMTADAKFLIGSVSKVWTGSVIMALVDRGEVELDRPARDYLDQPLAADPEADEITVRQLLQHTSGLDDDLQPGLGERGFDASAKYLAAIAKYPLVNAPGRVWSYCNTALTFAGRIAELVCGSTYDDVVAELLCRPLGLRQTTTLPEETMLGPFAVGHLPGPDGKPAVTGNYTLPRAFGPAGSTICASAADLAAFGRMHLNGGRAPDGTSVLSPESVAEMARPQVRVLPPECTLPSSHIGIAWTVSTRDGCTLLSHGGGNIGQACHLGVVPELDAVIAVNTNFISAFPFCYELQDALFGFTPNPALSPPPPADVRIDPGRYVGTYERLIRRCRIEERDGSLWYMPLIPSHYPSATDEGPAYRMTPYDEVTFDYDAPNPDGSIQRLIFMEADERGRFEFVRINHQYTTPRIGEQRP